MSDNRYLQDNTLEEGYYDRTGIDSSTFITGAAVILGSFAGYKTGLFKGGIKYLMQEASEHRPLASEMFNDIRKWTKSDANAPEKSLFRMGIGGSFKDFYKNASLDNVKKVLVSTREDIDGAKRRFGRTLKRLTEDSDRYVVRNSTHNTGVLRDIKSIDEAVAAYSDKYSNSKRALKSRGYSELILNNTQTKEMADQSLKRKGYRNVELEDFFDVEIDDNKRVHLIGKTKYDFSDKDKFENKSAIKKLEYMLNYSVVGEDGITTLYKNKNPLRLHQKYNDNYKKMIIDKSLFIDSENNIIDLRNQSKSFKEFTRNLATDWSIPVVGFNPLRMFGVDKLGKEKSFMGSISEHDVAPFLTGVRGNSSENTIRNLKNKVDVLNGVEENITILNGNAYRVSDDKNGIAKMNYKSKKELISVPKNVDIGTSALTPSENALRKMSGLTTKTFEDYKPEDGWKYYRQQTAKFFDIGYQENNNIKDKFDSLGDFSNPDSYIEKIISKISPKPYKSSKTAKHFSNISSPGFDGKAKDSFFVVNKSTTLGDIVTNKFNKETIKNYGTQFFSSVDGNFENVNSKTGKVHFMLERLNQGISSVGLGLSINSIKSPWDTFKNLSLKRFLPIYGAYQAYEFMNMFGEDGTENGTKPSTIHQRILSGMAKTDIGTHKILETLGVSRFTKYLQELTPGSDMLEELPGITKLNLKDTAEERKEYWEKGYDPVRKGRFWSLNETPFVGGKVQYYKANPLRRAMADARFSDSLYGSRKEYFSQIFRPSYYDKKNYNDRPYLMASAPFENVPLVGPTLSSVAAKVIPPKKMHEEYWNLEENRPKTPDEIALMNKGYMQSFNESNEERSSRTDQTTLKDKMTIGDVYNIGEFSEKEPKINNTTTTINTDVISQEQGMLAAYRTSGGKINIVDYTENPKGSMYDINKNGYTPGQIKGLRERTSSIGKYDVSNAYLDNSMFQDATSPYDIENTLKSQFTNTANAAGIYGFGVSAFVTGDIGAGRTVIDTPGYSRSFGKGFWDKETGGAGGDLSEIFRRFVQNRKNNVHYYNPIKNNMPDWVPGSNGFIDFQHGDPYTKIARGEERLPGEGYERLNNLNIDSLLDLEIGSSSIGKTKDEIIKHLLNQDEITDPEMLDIVNYGTKEHKRIESLMLKNGIAIDSEVEIKDEENNITGTYDIRMNDESSPTGEAIMDIKTISAKGMEKIKKDKAPKDINRRQVNWYLHHTNKKNKGYLMYINRDDPDDIYSLGFNYDKKLYKSTMATVDEARTEVRNMLDSGQIARGDLYKTIDKFRILADTAPYSEEFTEMNQMMSNMQLDEKDANELRAIRDRVAEVKKPYRFYDYRFKNSDVETENIKLGRMLKSTTFAVHGSDSPIKLAGVKLKKDSPKYKEAMEFLNKHLEEGSHVKIKVAKDLSERQNKDLFKTTDAVVYNNGININKALISKGLAEEDTEDFSPTGIRARYNAVERGFGKVWENIAHFDSYANTKLLQVRTAAEDYERKQVYGKDFKEWSEPIGDFLIPSIWKNTNRNTLYGIAGGAAVGYMFGAVGSKGSKYGKLIGTIAGAATIATSKMYKAGYEATTGEKWIPKEKERERELNDYLDKIKFIKNRKLFEVYSKKALVEDGVDVKDMISSNKISGEKISNKKRKIQNAKREAKLSKSVTSSDFKDTDVDLKLIDKLPTFLRGILTLDVVNAKKNREKSILKTVNEEINGLVNYRKSFTLSENSMKAIEYYNESEKTMQGYDPGEQITNIMSALPKKDKQYFKHFLKAPANEREKILEIAPKYMKRALQSSYGMKVDNKDSLPDYFSKHYLPDDNWDGWQENYNLNAMKVKMVQNEKLEFGSFDIWEDQKREADAYGPTDIPNIEYDTKNTEVVKRKLSNILGTAGYEDLNFSFSFGKNSNTININMHEDKKEKYEKKLKERLGVV